MREARAAARVARAPQLDGEGETGAESTAMSAEQDGPRPGEAPESTIARLMQTVAALPADMPGEPGRDPAIPPGHGFGFTFNAAALSEADVIRLEVLNTSHVITETTLADLRQTAVQRPQRVHFSLSHRIRQCRSFVLSADG